MARARSSGAKKAPAKRSPRKRVTKKAPAKKPARKRRAKARPARDGTRSGRKPLLTDKVIELLEEAYEAGASVKDSAYYAGIHPATLFRYLERAEEDEAAEVYSMFRELRDRLDRARAKGNVEDLKTLRLHGKVDWKALAHRLAMRDPQNYSPARKLEVAGKGGGPITFYIPEMEKDDAEA
jgi:hypothetical protein